MDKKEMKMSGSTMLTKQTGGIALIGALIGIVISILLNAAYSLTPDGAGLPVPPWQPALEQTANPALTFGPPVEVYHFYGRFVLLVLAAFLVGLYGLYANQRAAFKERPSRLLVWGYRLAMTGLVLNLVGNLGDYWVSIGETIGFISFVVGTVVGLLLQVIGLILLGFYGLRSGSLPRAAALAFVLWFPFTIVLLLVGMQNLPSAPLLGLSLAWVIVGGSMVLSSLENRMLQKQSL
jgi:hypothetical protein